MSVLSHGEGRVAPLSTAAASSGAGECNSERKGVTVLTLETKRKRNPEVVSYKLLMHTWACQPYRFLLKVPGAALTKGPFRQACSCLMELISQSPAPGREPPGCWPGVLPTHGPGVCLVSLLRAC